MRNLKKIHISLLSFILIVLVFGTVTYAWLSLSLINNIDGLTLTASSGDELELSFDGIEYYSVLPSSPLEGSVDGIRLYDVTSIDGINFQTGGLREVGVAVPNEHYLSFDLWIRTSQAERDIFLINDVSKEMKFGDKRNGTYFVSKGVSWRSPHTFFNGPLIEDTVQAGDIGVYYGHDAIRISIIELQDENNPYDQRDAEELRTYLYDPSGNPNRGYGSPVGAFSYFFQRTLIYQYLPTQYPPTSYRLSEMDPHNPYQALDNESLVATLQKTDNKDIKNRTYYSGKVRINIWVEGWDADAFDAIDKDQIQIQLQFKAARRAL
ncbi:MAG: hypothetical protein CVV57_03565 [Tenericutes bacterium HGW-Tenericutes-2]|nr:MAG: hypothetical protein CVV57_03565 [Tenericutes bacterium HGW-Tenericutes-2]